MTREEERKEYEEWLANLKIGSEVSYHSRGIYGRLGILKINRETPKRFYAGHSCVFNKSDGFLIGQHGRIRKPTEEDRELIRHRIALRRCNDLIASIQTRGLDTEHLNKLSDILQALTPDKED